LALGHMKYCSQEMQPPQKRVVTSSNENSELTNALGTALL